jgi:hypothetical protein
MKILKGICMSILKEDTNFEKCNKKETNTIKAYVCCFAVSCISLSNISVFFHVKKYFL